MNVSAVPSVDRFTASSDFELKLVVTMLLGMASVLVTVPVELIWSRKIGEVIPKLPSVLLFFQKLLLLVGDGEAPLSVAFAVPHTAVDGQTGGNDWPAIIVEPS